MKCALIFVSLIALSCAVPLFQEASIRIAVAEDDTITIHGASGNKLIISRVLEHLGPKNVEIFVGVEQGTMKRILLDQETSLDLVNAQHQTGLTEADILVQIFRNYQGDVDMNTYTHLLREIHTHAQSGHVSMAVYNILKSFIVREASWESHADMTDYVSSKWYHLLSHLGLESTGLGLTQSTPIVFGKLSHLREASIRIAVADDVTISLCGASGNKLVISRVLGHLGPKNVEVLMEDEHGSLQRVLLDQETNEELLNVQFEAGLTEADILVRVFKNYQGHVDINTYTHLLRQLNNHVHSGHVSMAVYNILKRFVIQEVTWERHVTSNTDLAEYGYPEWYSLFNGLGLEGTGSELTHAYGLDYVSAKPRNVIGQSGFARRVTPEEFYGRDLDALIRQTIEPAQIQLAHQQQGYLWQQPMYRRAQQTKWFPKQLNSYHNYVNAPFVY